MYEKPFHAEIITPRRVVFRGEITSLSAPGVEGGFQVLAGHAPLLSAISVGQLTIKSTDGNDIRYAASGGFVEVRSNNVVVLAESAERADEIDIDRARAAHERAERRLHSQEEGVDAERARAALLRALNRLKVARSE